MFRYNKIKHFKIRQGLLGQELWIKYCDEQEMFLTAGKVDLDDFKEKQKVYFEKAKNEMLEKAKGWSGRHQRCLYFKKRGLTGTKKSL